MMNYKLTDFLPTTKKELEIRGWDEVDVVLFSGDAYVDHPSFGAAVIGRVIEAEGWRVAIVPQPDWRGDHRDFTKMGRPRRFFAISAGCMDSMVNHYTANKRLRSNDAYTPDGKAGMRPDRATITYAKIIKQLYPDVPLVIGGIEASLRRFSHYDYWDDSYHRSILADTGADLLIYGMGEKPVRELVRRLSSGATIQDCHDMCQIAYLANSRDAIHCVSNEIVELASHEECAKNKKTSAATFKTIEEESNKLNQTTLVQSVGNRYVVVNPPYSPMTTEELDAVYELPFTRQPHPKYKGKTIPAFDMIRWSINTHRGCWGGCAFCTISMHQGKFVVSRSLDSIIKEVRTLASDPEFKGYLSDLGGPSANMYMMRGKNQELCAKCKRPSCAFPSVCKNMNTDHAPLLEMYRAVDALPSIKKSFIGSGVRYDVVMHRTDSEEVNRTNAEYARELIKNHVSGRLKVAPEHTSDRVLSVMRKPSFALFKQFKQTFDRINESEHLNQQIIPYFISSHPGCEPIDMAELAIETKRLNFQLEQVQDFTPTPMTLATEMYHTGLDPYTLKPIFVARTKDDKLAQRQFFFWYKPEERRTIKQFLQKIKRTDIADRLFAGENNVGTRHAVSVDDTRNKPRHYEQERKAFFDKKRRRK
ncbi:MAG: YgiQ family radical SAM protein [Paludibacteraceae bacterium]|nr:YgiQ family radical SAM protein [Paludibacteraceae bacterium]